MLDKRDGSDGNGASSATTPPVARRSNARAGDMRDAVAELAERAQLIKQEAGSKVAAAMKDVISAAAGIAGFAIESARDLVQYMVKRGQMTPEEAEKLIQQAEAAHARRPASERSRPSATKIAAEKAAAAKAEAAARAAQMPPRPMFGGRPAAVKPASTPNGKTPAPPPTKTAAAPVKKLSKPATKVATRPAHKAPSTKKAAPVKKAPAAKKVSPAKAKSSKPVAKKKPKR